MTLTTVPAKSFNPDLTARRLKEAGFTDSQADAIAETAGEVISNLCTKADLARSERTITHECRLAVLKFSGELYRTLWIGSWILMISAAGLLWIALSIADLS